MARKKLDKRSSPQRSRRAKIRTNPGGRPLGVVDELLFRQRDGFIDLFAMTWGTIGWGLRQATTREDVVAAFASVATPAHLSHLTKPFTRPTTRSASANDLRKARRIIGAERDQAFERESVLRELGGRVFQTSHALQRGVAEENREIVLAQHRSRLDVYGPARAHDDERLEVLRVLESDLTEADAAYSQDQVLAFVKGKYALTPRNLACALAGLPQIGWEQSFRRCARDATLYWPSRWYRTFLIIESCSNESPSSFLDSLKGAVLALPRKTPHDVEFRRALCASGRHFRKAIEEISTIADVGDSRPYRVFDAYMRNLSATASEEERLVASIEDFDPATASPI